MACIYKRTNTHVAFSFSRTCFNESQANFNFKTTNIFPSVCLIKVQLLDRFIHPKLNTVQLD
jgi:hypothetical protein